MKPSRELDALVAAIMGRCGHVLKRIQDDDYCSHFQCQKCDEEFWGLAWHEGYCAFPEYSTQIDAAFTVDKPGWLWEFKEMPETLTVELYTSLALRRKAIEMYPILPKKVILVRRKWLDDKTQTYAWLRCLAALEAVEVNVGE